MASRRNGRNYSGGVNEVFTSSRIADRSESGRRPEPSELSSELASHEPQSARRRCGFLLGALEADAPTLGLQNSSFGADRKLIPNQSVLGLTARTSALQN